MSFNKSGAYLGRIFIGPVEIAGIADGLADGLRELGVDATVVLSSLHRFSYRVDNSSWLIGFWQKLNVLRNSIPRSDFIRKSLVVLVHAFWSWLVFLSALKRYDAFIYLYGQTITNSEIELWLLRRFGRKVIFAGVGSDTRPPYIDGGLYPGESDEDLPDPACLIGQTKRCKERLKVQERYADYWINSPAAAHFHERPFIGWPSIGIPRNITVPDSKGCEPGTSVRILHCPSNSLAKGTPAILSAIDRLKSRGFDIDFVLIQNMPNQQVLQELQCCDFVVDQLYSDAPMAGFATEAAHFAKPAVVGGYFASVVGDYLVGDNIPPSLFVLPDEIELAIEKLIVDRDFRIELGVKAREFVVARWALSAIAMRFLNLLRDDVPEGWWCDPQKLSYLEGSGLQRERVRRLVASVIGYGGVSALQLFDKPQLEQAFLEFSKSG